MSFAVPKHARGAPVLPLAAMVDMLFLLVVFLMSVSTFHDEAASKEVTLPDASTGYTTNAAPPIKITIFADSTIKLGPTEMTFDQLEVTLRDYARAFQDDLVLALGIDFNVTDTFTISFAGQNIASVETSSNDPQLYHNARAWVWENRADLVESACRGTDLAAPDPGQCAQGMLHGYREYARLMGLEPREPD